MTYELKIITFYQINNKSKIKNWNMTYVAWSMIVSYKVKLKNLK